IIQDMGYYPHGSFFFSDLTHYVRSGDFVLALLRDAKDINGFAFALGALAHYVADNDGHPMATQSRGSDPVSRAEKEIWRLCHF
ncbi:MAG: zinc dependent phospholipase C family protein, partial [Acidobacteriia bacterium]|nr:zinc dependent phospholipase C family protein [Terriglobia bacterium]